MLGTVRQGLLNAKKSITYHRPNLSKAERIIRSWTYINKGDLTYLESSEIKIARMLSVCPTNFPEGSSDFFKGTSTSTPTRSFACTGIPQTNYPLWRPRSNCSTKRIYGKGINGRLGCGCICRVQCDERITWRCRRLVEVPKLYGAVEGPRGDPILSSTM